MGRYKIISDGTPRGTQVLLDGEPMPNIVDIEWDLSVGGSPARMKIEVLNVEVDVSTDDVEITETTKTYRRYG